ncbi:hypothetical protein HHK36_005689 [Tetracentron sinense]|uniref:Uncharacterized protein n=1 Tax=Tetracentron sinense TaxID=13715 RepID=A0A834ZUN9_TETSI|nr:hypothetical protein HHK36_005689 [Tetracentron sinense]
MHRVLISKFLINVVGLNAQRYSQRKEDDDHNHDHGMERARSTAEEFSRVAKEKAESVRQTAKEAWEGVKETAAGESDPHSAEQKYKETIEKGNYDNMGDD